MTVYKSPTKIISVGTEEPIWELIGFGWDFNIYYYFFGSIPVIVYTKPLIK